MRCGDEEFLGRAGLVVYEGCVLWHFLRGNMSGVHSHSFLFLSGPHLVVLSAIWSISFLINTPFPFTLVLL